MVWFVAWLFARRYTNRRVTYGAIWRQVAAKALPPAWRRILKTLLSWAFALTLIASAAMHAAGVEKPPSDKPPPLFVLICLDNSYSMRLQHDGQTRLQLAHDRAAQILEKLQPEDRAVIVWSSHGQPIAGPILKQSDSISDSPATDVAELSAKDFKKFADELSLPAQENGWQKMI
ncbi:MAG: VWA domain-containing protein, partial [Planctomycetota bacterium]